jgi:hypothetical protein
MDHSTAQRRVVTRASCVVAALAMALIALGGAAVPVGAAGSTITVSPSTVPAGGTVTISGSVPTTGTGSCAPSDGATLTSTEALFPNGGFGPTVPRTSSGSFSTTYVVPASTPAGTYQIGMRCGGGNVGISATLTVTSSAAGAVPGQPGFTG